MKITRKGLWEAVGFWAAVYLACFVLIGIPWLLFVATGSPLAVIGFYLFLAFVCTIFIFSNPDL